MEAEVINTQLPAPISFNGEAPTESFVNATPDWRAILEQAVSEHPKGKAGVSVRLGVSRSYVSRVLSSGTSAYEAPPSFITKVIERLYMVAECPHTSQPQPFSECRAVSLSPPPTHNPSRMALWKSCQRCPNKPIKD